ncbi:MAG TPA: hypothetical protein VIF15_15190 [Polyangiaceae bacterium]|jgi:hypothetical protein
MNRPLLTAFLLLSMPLATGCAGSVEVTRTFTPTAASRVQGEKLQPTAILRDDERIPLPPGSRVEADQVVTPRGHVVELRRTDGVEMHGKIAPGDSIPGGGRVESSRSTGALAAGVVILALSYVPTAYVGAASNRPEDRVLLAPVVGPWIDFAGRSRCVAPASPVPLPVDPCLGETASRAAIVTSGAMQGLGALLTVIGLPASSRIVDGGDRGVAVVPTGNGAMMVGSF